MRGSDTWVELTSGKRVGVGWGCSSLGFVWSMWIEVVEGVIGGKSITGGALCLYSVDSFPLVTMLKRRRKLCCIFGVSVRKRQIAVFFGFRQCGEGVFALFVAVRAKRARRARKAPGGSRKSPRVAPG